MDFAVGLIFIVAVVALGLWVTKRSEKKRLEQNWNGTVTKKWIAVYSNDDDDDGGVTRTPSIEVQIDGGKKMKLSVSGDTYNSLAEGDKVKKEVGQKDPVKA